MRWSTFLIVFELALLARPSRRSRMCCFRKDGLATNIDTSNVRRLTAYASSLF